MVIRGDAPSTSAATALAVVLAAGCASTDGGFLSEGEIPRCAALLGEGRAFPATVVRERAGAAAGRPYEIEIEERGSGDRDRVIILVHGALSDRRLWRFMVGRLAAEHDLMLVDLPGCGGSDRPAPADMGPRGYDPDTLAAAVLEAVGRRLEERGGDPAVTLVGHSVGAAAILRALGSPRLRMRYGALLSRVDGAVLFSPPDCSYAKRDPVFERILRLSPFKVTLGNMLGLVREGIAESLRNGVEDPSSTPREEIDRMWEILSDPERLAASQSIIHSAIPFTDDLLPDWERIERLEADMARIRVPCLVVCGGRDDAVPEALSFKIVRQLPDARLRILKRTGHSVPTERPEESAALVLDFVASRGDGWAAYEESPRGIPDAAAPAAALAGR